MPRRTLFLIILLVVAVLGLLALSLQRTETPKPQTPVSVAKTTLSLLAPRSSALQNEVGLFSSDVVINTQDQSVTAVQLELSYDPLSLTDVNIEPGSFIKTPIVLLKNIDGKNGKVSYALGVPLGQKGVSGQSVVATLSFTKLRTAGTTSISFLPKSLVTSEGISQSVLKSATGLTFDLTK